MDQRILLSLVRIWRVHFYSNSRVELELATSVVIEKDWKDRKVAKENWRARCTSHRKKPLLSFSLQPRRRVAAGREPGVRPTSREPPSNRTPNSVRTLTWQNHTVNSKRPITGSVPQTPRPAALSAGRFGPSDPSDEPLGRTVGPTASQSCGMRQFVNFQPPPGPFNWLSRTCFGSQRPDYRSRDYRL